MAQWGVALWGGMHRAERLLRSVELVYQAALAPGAWPAALQAVVEHLESGHMIVLAQGRDQSDPPFLTSFGVDEAAAWRAAVASARDEGPTSLLPQGVVFDRAAIWPDEEFERSLYYNEYIRPMDGFRSLAIVQARANGCQSMALCRSKRDPEFDAAEAAALQNLGRHMTTALDFQTRLGSLERRCCELERAFDQVSDALILTDAAGRPVFVNGRAAQILDEADGLSAGIRGLLASGPEWTRRLRAAIATAACEDRAVDLMAPAGNGQHPAERGRLCLPRPSQRPPLSLVLLPLWRLDPMLAGAPRPRVAIFVTEPDAPPRIDEAALAQAFGLRRREAAAVALLAAGFGPAEIAAKLDIGLGTVRNYLKSAFHKTDTHSQAALVALVRGFAMPMA